MKTLFVDNCRGFSDTYIDLQDVNFLVGENSTGKTSILWLANLMAEQQFWMSWDFTSVNPGYSHFSELVSVNAKDGSYFRIGLIETAYERQYRSPDSTAPKSEYLAFLLTFGNRDGRPYLSEMYYQLGNAVVQLKAQKKRWWLTIDFDRPIPAISNRPFPPNSYRDSAVDLVGERIEMDPDVPFMYALMNAVQERAKNQAKQNTKAKPSGVEGNRTSTAFSEVIASLVSMSEGMVWIAPIRTKPKRTYDEYLKDFSSEGEHTPYLIKRLLSRTKAAKAFHAYLQNIGRQSGLFEAVEIKRYDRKRADAPFELDIKLKGGTLGINTVGYGVSQSLPILVEIFARPRGTQFAIQQPEVHLHPRAQAALGDLFFELAATENKKFIVETHSDYLIDRFRARCKGSSTMPTAQLIFFERSKAGNVAHHMTISADGTLPESQPPGYREFFLNEALNVLDLG